MNEVLCLDMDGLGGLCIDVSSENGLKSTPGHPLVIITVVCCCCYHS